MGEWWFTYLQCLVLISLWFTKWGLWQTMDATIPTSTINICTTVVCVCVWQISKLCLTSGDLETEIKVKVKRCVPKVRLDSRFFITRCHLQSQHQHQQQQTSSPSLPLGKTHLHQLKLQHVLRPRKAILARRAPPKNNGNKKDRDPRPSHHRRESRGQNVDGWCSVNMSSYML